MNSSPGEHIQKLLQELYGEKAVADIWPRLENWLRMFATELERAESPPHPGGLSQRDSILITYADMLSEKDRPPLQTLRAFCNSYLSGVVSGIHLLPFFPWSSDDGFSVVDYTHVDPDLGTWDDIHQLSRDFLLMFDAVINHVSVESAWFKGFLRGDPAYREFFIVPQDGWDFLHVIRPRTSPLLTSFETPHGIQKVWTTFSADQVDLNYHCPGLLMEIIELLLSYIQHGARLIRLDAIAFIWKESGTTCLHLPQVHQIVQLFRAVFDWVAPEVLIVTETNVPHRENISYFGDGTNEAQMVYNFPLPPLVLHTLRTADSRKLSQWAGSLQLPSKQTTFFNFLASHDGIGLNPVRGILDEQEIEALVEQTRAHGGLINAKSNPDGSSSPYELNINYFDALNNPESGEPLQLQVDRFICSQAIMLSLLGVPGIYIHSLLGSRGWPEGVALKGYNRAINRQKLERADLESELHDAATIRSRIFQAFSQLLKIRAASPAFDPHGWQQVLDCGPGVFGLVRDGQDSSSGSMICLHNVTAWEQSVKLDMQDIAPEMSADVAIKDLLRGDRYEAGLFDITLDPYQVAWLVKV